MEQIRIQGIAVWKAVFGLRLGFSHNLASRREAETLLVAVYTEKGNAGWGQALPRTYLTGESLSSVLDDIQNRWWPAVRGSAFPAQGALPAAREFLQPLYAAADRDRCLSSYSAAETAVLSAVADESGVTLAVPSAPAPAQIPLVGVISSGGIRKAVWTARALRALGYTRFKVKVGCNEEEDTRRLAAVRRAVGQGSWLAADANAAWTAEEAERRIAGLRRFGVSLVEEPLRPDAAVPGVFHDLEKSAGIPLMADESLCTREDAARLLREGGPSWWNLRFAKNGGFAGMEALAAAAKESGSTVYQGILVGETSLLAAAARAVLFTSGAVCAEYGFPRFFLKGDPFRGGPGGFRGCMTPAHPSVTGLGIRCLSGPLSRTAVLEWSAGMAENL